MALRRAGRGQRRSGAYLDDGPIADAAVSTDIHAALIGADHSAIPARQCTQACQVLLSLGWPSLSSTARTGNISQPQRDVPDGRHVLDLHAAND